jgi:hypothetical protein
VGDDGAEENEGCHPQRHAAARLVDLLDDQVVARFGCASHQMIEQRDAGPADGRQKEQSGMIETCARRDVETSEEGCAKRTHRNCHGDEKQCPAGNRYRMIMPVAGE